MQRPDFLGEFELERDVGAGGFADGIAGVEYGDDVVLEQGGWFGGLVCVCAGFLADVGV